MPGQEAPILVAARAGIMEENMGLSSRFKDVVRRLAVTLFAVFELIGLPRVPEKEDGNKGGAR